MKNRVITALLLLAVLLPIIYISQLAFKILAIGIIIITTYEMLEIKKEKSYMLITKLIVYTLNILPVILVDSITSVNLVYIAAYLLIFYSLMIIDKSINFEDVSYLFTFCCFIIMAANSAVYLREMKSGFYIIVYIILTTAASDTGAFFAGSYLGKNKLIERISPNKTIEGFIGGLIGAVVIGYVYSLFLPTGLNTTLLVIEMSLILGATAALGDLFFSSIKRTYKIKDFSNMLPGHGGILDRVDSHFTNLIIYFIIIAALRR